MSSKIDPQIQRALHAGLVIPAHPLALDASRHLDERRQRALTRYYIDAGAGGIAVGVHTTQFAIRDPGIGLFAPVLQLAAEIMRDWEQRSGREVIKVAGGCGLTPQAVREASFVWGTGYDIGLLSLAAMKNASDDELIAHCQAVAEILPLFGFYLQPSVGGRILNRSFWRRFAEIPNVVAIKIAPFNRYQTLDVVRAVAEAGRDDVALYTGNDDNIVLDLITAFQFDADGIQVERRIAGGLLGHWAVWTRRAVELLKHCHAATKSVAVPDELLRLAGEVTDSNAAFFDAANGFKGVIAG